MTKRKIVTRLIRNYTIILVLFAGVMLTIFFTLLNKQESEIHLNQLQEQGDTIAKNIEESQIENEERTEESTSRHSRMRHRMNRQSSTQSYLELISRLSNDDIFIVDDLGNPLYSSNHMSQEEPKELDEEGRFILDKVQGVKEPVFFEKGTLKDNNRIGYGVPLKNKEENVYGSVIVLSTKKGSFTQSLADYRLLIWSLLIALLITVLISIGMAKRFVKPIHEMGEFTDELIKQNYQSSLDIKTKDELAELGSKLIVLKNRLLNAQKEQDNKERSQKLFLSQISHELRTPVMVIKNSLETLNDDFLNEFERKEYLSHLMVEIEQLNLLVNDLLELSRLQSTEFSIVAEEVNLNYVVEDGIRSYRPILIQKKQQVNFSSNLSERDVFIGDYQRLLQLIKILIDNASKYSEKDQTIFIVVDKSLDEIQLIISNKTNQRLNQSELNHLFEAFNRGNVQNENGHGLGLTIAKQITKRHGGAISFNVLENQQVEVRIKFPLEKEKKL